MRCVTPMFREFNPYLEKDSNARIVPRSEILEQMDFDPNVIRNSVDKRNKYYKIHGQPKKIETIPCGHCWACQCTYAAEWATKIMCEASMHDYNYWITLTYDDEHLPMYEEFTDGETNFFNDGTWTGTLEPEHVTNFIKKLRKHTKTKGIKYYYCGEYGTIGQRPHYHLILMGAPLDISQFYDFYQDDRLLMHWKSHEIEELWDKGMIDMSELEWSNAAYTARYCTKKIFMTPKSETEYAKMGKIKEFVRMSRRPGIGTAYYNKNKYDMYAGDEMIMRTVKGNIGSFHPPFDKKFKEEFPDQYKLLKEGRRAAGERAKQLKQELSDYTDQELMEIENKKQETIANMLPREL